MSKLSLRRWLHQNSFFPSKKTQQILTGRLGIESNTAYLRKNAIVSGYTFRVLWFLLCFDLKIVLIKHSTSVWIACLNSEYDFWISIWLTPKRCFYWLVWSCSATLWNKIASKCKFMFTNLYICKWMFLGKTTLKRRLHDFACS